MPPTVLPVWDGFLDAREMCFVEIDPAAEGDARSHIERVPKTADRVVLSIRGSSPLLWMPKSQSRAAESLDQAIDAVRAKGMRIGVSPRADGFPSDIPSTLGFLRARAGADIGLVLEPAAMLTADLAKTAADHFIRIQETLLLLPQTVAIVLSNTIWDDSGIAKRTGINDGKVPAGLISRLALELPPNIAIYRVE